MIETETASSQLTPVGVIVKERVPEPLSGNVSPLRANVVSTVLGP